MLSKTINKNSILSSYSTLVVLSALYVVLLFTSNDMNIYLFSTISILFFIYTILFFDDERMGNKLNKVIESGTFNKLNNKNPKFYFRILFVLLTILVLIFQGQYLNFETIDADIHTYLLVGNDVLRGSLPYVNEWDDKGPILYLFYALLIFLSGKNLIIFKIYCDILFLIITYLIAKIIFLLSNRELTSKPIIGSVFFIFLMSSPWGTNEYSEIFCIFFISSSLYLLLQNDFQRNATFIAGIFYGFSTLTNQGSGIFIILFIYFFYCFSKAKNFVPFLAGLAFVHSVILYLYMSRDLLDIYISTLFFIPLKYSQQSFNFISEFVVFLRETFEYSAFSYSIILFLVVITIFKIIKDGFNSTNIFIILALMLSILFFYLGSTGYKHHLIFMLFFLCILVISTNISSKKYTWVLCFLLIGFFITLGPSATNNSFHNLTNLNKIYSGYPLKELASEIDNSFDDTFKIFSLDHNLILFYLDIQNQSFIIHPTNYTEAAIVGELERIGRISNNELPYQISRKPDVVICSPAIRFLLTEVNCEVTDFFTGYNKIETYDYFKDEFRTYYKDPYRLIDLYIKSN